MKFSHLEGIDCLAIVGATGLVGKECLDILAEQKIKIRKVKLLASEKSAGEGVDYLDTEFAIESLSEHSFDDVEVAFFSVPNDVSRRFVPIAADAGCLVIDDSSEFRLDPEVPLVVPQVNGASLRDFDGRLIAIPNCNATPLSVALKPILDRYGIERVVVSTYQSVSGAGKEAFEELSKQAIALLSGGSEEAEVFPHRIAFNCLPQIGTALEHGDTEEEEKIVCELRKILDEPELRVSVTAVRVPTFCAHGMSVNVELKTPFGNIQEIREVLDGFPGLKVLDKPESHIYPTNVEAIGSDDTFVGRIRADRSVAMGLNFWVISDNLRKGAALNALECMETLYHYRRMS